ncbi:hypothetical protein AB1N83_012542 [Pleurotus pulmonarius]
MRCGIRDGQMQRVASQRPCTHAVTAIVRRRTTGKWRRRQKKSREGEEKKGEPRSPVRRADVKDPDPDDGR